ncbi:unnamed protein product, partial [Amoebophrya sp. A25]
ATSVQYDKTFLDESKAREQNSTSFIDVSRRRSQPIEDHVAEFFGPGSLALDRAIRQLQEWGFLGYQGSLPSLDETAATNSQDNTGLEEDSVCLEFVPHEVRLGLGALAEYLKIDPISEDFQVGEYDALSENLKIRPVPENFQANEYTRWHAPLLSRGPLGLLKITFSKLENEIVGNRPEGEAPAPDGDKLNADTFCYYRWALNAMEIILRGCVAARLAYMSRVAHDLGIGLQGALGFGSLKKPADGDSDGQATHDRDLELYMNMVTRGPDDDEEAKKVAEFWSRYYH